MAPGEVRIWDEGTYDCHKFREDEVIVTFHGERVQGKYALFQTQGQELDDPPHGPAPGTEREAMPERLAPMLAKRATLPADEREWAYRDQVGRRARDRLLASPGDCGSRAAT